MQTGTQQTAVKVSPKQIPLITADKLHKQNYKCALCRGSLRAGATKKPVLDHDHATGRIRAALCRNCNGIEGKIHNLARRARNKLTTEEWLLNLSEYWADHRDNPDYLIHPTYKSPEDKRLERNANARLARRAAVCP